MRRAKQFQKLDRAGMPGTGKTACVKKVINKYPQQYFNMMHYPKIEVSGELREGYTVGIDEFDLVE